MAAQDRFPVLLDGNYPPERRVIEALDAAPRGIRACVMRTLVLIGFEAAQAVTARRNQYDQSQKGTD